jgi:metal-sulfur cluster biosynthetic enzyme
VKTAVLSADTVRQALRQVKDPELDMNIVDLGLVYDVEVDGGLVRINMTLTSPGCPAGPMITNDIYKVVRALEGVSDVDIDCLGAVLDAGADRSQDPRDDGVLAKRFEKRLSQHVDLPPP